MALKFFRIAILVLFSCAASILYAADITVSVIGDPEFRNGFQYWRSSVCKVASDPICTKPQKIYWSASTKPPVWRLKDYAAQGSLTDSWGVYDAADKDCTDAFTGGCTLISKVKESWTPDPIHPDYFLSATDLTPKTVEPGSGIPVNSDGEIPVSVSNNAPTFDSHSSIAAGTDVLSYMSVTVPPAGNSITLNMNYFNEHYFSHELPVPGIVIPPDVYVPGPRQLPWQSSDGGWAGLYLDQILPDNGAPLAGVKELIFQAKTKIKQYRYVPCDVSLPGSNCRQATSFTTFGFDLWSTVKGKAGTAFENENGKIFLKTMVFDERASFDHTACSQYTRGGTSKGTVYDPGQVANHRADLKWNCYYFPGDKGLLFHIPTYKLVTKNITDSNAPFRTIFTDLNTDPDLRGGYDLSSVTGRPVDLTNIGDPIGDIAAPSQLNTNDDFWIADWNSNPATNISGYPAYTTYLTPWTPAYTQEQTSTPPYLNIFPVSKEWGLPAELFVSVNGKYQYPILDRNGDGFLDGGDYTLVDLGSTYGISFVTTPPAAAKIIISYKRDGIKNPYAYSTLVNGLYYRDLPPRLDSTVYAVGVRIGSNNHTYISTQAGTSASSAPEFSTVQNSVTIDGGVEWKNITVIGRADMTYYPAGLMILPAPNNGYAYRSLNAGTSGVSPFGKTSPAAFEGTQTLGTVIVDGDISWETIGFDGNDSIFAGPTIYSSFSLNPDPGLGKNTSIKDPMPTHSTLMESDEIQFYGDILPYVQEAIMAAHDTNPDLFTSIDIADYKISQVLAATWESDTSLTSTTQTISDFKLEAKISGDPLVDDDHDLIPNIWEKDNESNPLDSSDATTVAKNGLTYKFNYDYGLDPKGADIANTIPTLPDSNGLSYGFSDKYGFDPYLPGKSAETAPNGLTYAYDDEHGLNPNDVDNDDDDMPDIWEVQYPGAVAPLIADANLPAVGNCTASWTNLQIYEHSLDPTLCYFYLSVRSDYDGDRTSDVMMKDYVTSDAYFGQLMLFKIFNGTVAISNNYPGAGYQYIASLDMNGNGIAETLVRDALTGAWYSYEVIYPDISVSVPALPLENHWKFAAAGDFNGDGTDDILLRDGTIWMVYYLNNGGVSASEQLTLGSSYLPLAAGDMNGDGKAELLLKHDSAALRTWSVYNFFDTSLSTPVGLNSSPYTSTAWQFQTLADLNADGKMDVVLRNASTWQWTGFTTGINFVSTAYNLDNLYVSSEYSLASAGDFDGNGTGDLLLKKYTGQYFMFTTSANQPVPVGSPALTTPGSAMWRVLVDGIGHGNVKNDYNDDDIAGWIWKGKSNGKETLSEIWQLTFPLYSVNWAIPNRFYPPPFPDQVNWDIVTTGDFDNDGDADIIWRHNSTAQWKLWEMQNGLRISQPAQTDFDLAHEWTVVGAGDTDKDGDDDVILNKTSTGAVLIWEMQNHTIANTHTVGTKADHTLNRIGDFNKDGDVDLLFRKNGADALITWEIEDSVFVLERTLNSTGLGYSPVCAGDFDHDGDDDIMFWHSLTNQEKWFVMENYVRTQSVGSSNDGFIFQGCGDYDGDGDADMLSRRSSDDTNRVVLQQNVLTGGGSVSKQTVYTNPFGGPNAGDPGTGFVYRGNSN